MKTHRMHELIQNAQNAQKNRGVAPKTFSSDHGEAELRRSARILEPFGAVDQPDNRLCLNSVRQQARPSELEIEKGCPEDLPNSLYFYVCREARILASPLQSVSG